MNKPAITIIGAGHIARALIGGLIHAGYPSERICATCPTLEHLQELEQEFSIRTTQNNAQAATQADVLILAVKPRVVEIVLAELSSIVVERQPLLISLAAGISEKHMRSLLSESVVIVRAMPNMPALIGYGMTVLYATPNISGLQKQQAESIFATVGATHWLEDEQQMHAVTAISGCGPAYFFLLMEALQEGALAMGLPPDIARQLTAQTALGAAQMVSKDQDAETLRHQVASPGGCTERALQVLEAGKFRQLVFDAIKAAEARSIEVAQ